MATVKAIDSLSIHQIQSGQVIVDLCSVVKELVENSLDASATSIDVRFKNNGLDSIEVQDNGDGISQENYETIALKHYTSKISNYDDLSGLRTFGFRGEALSSLCAVSKFHIVTAKAEDAPKGTRLNFDLTGTLSFVSVVACQKGTNVVVEDLFHGLPVRRRELEKNIKREYGKVLALLHSYACISTGVRLSVSNVAAKGKKTVVFSTNSNATTKANIANVYGAKTLQALIPLELSFELSPSQRPLKAIEAAQDGAEETHVRILGHISRPVYGEGRQTPDRQMFFVNSRPCNLPQVAKAVNEVYKSYNTSQSPFIFANLEMDTTAYDVNVSPDKRTILLHDQNALLESLKAALSEMFDTLDQTMPSSTLVNKSAQKFHQPKLSVTRDTSDRQKEESPAAPAAASDDDLPPAESESENEASEGSHPFSHSTRHSSPSNDLTRDLSSHKIADTDELRENETAPSRPTWASLSRSHPRNSTNDHVEEASNSHQDTSSDAESTGSAADDELPIASLQPQSTPKGSGIVPNAFARMRPLHQPNDVATITIGDKTIVSAIGSPSRKKRKVTPGAPAEHPAPANKHQRFLAKFAASGSAIESQLSQSQPDVQHDVDVDSGGSQSEDEASHQSQASLEMESDRERESAERSEREDEDGQSDQAEELEDGEYMDESAKKSSEEARIARMIQEAEEDSARPSEDNLNRAAKVFRGGRRKDSTLHLVQMLRTSVENVKSQLSATSRSLNRDEAALSHPSGEGEVAAGAVTAEERLSLTVSKSDFARMRIIGQFNLGFILAMRPSDSTGQSRSSFDELFIIDQHASDEKYNFERLQAHTIVQNQRLVQPRTLDLTAIEEETIISHTSVLTANGFIVEIDDSGSSPVGQRCRLVSLPMSREVIFDVKDLEELLALLGPGERVGDAIPRPGKVRRMFAMRACRGSVMVGKTLTERQMARIVTHMGEIDKPWNCPHGRPTMRHLFGFEDWEAWGEGDRIVGVEKGGAGKGEGGTDWAGYLHELSSQQDEDSEI